MCINEKRDSLEDSILRKVSEFESGEIDEKKKRALREKQEKSDSHQRIERLRERLHPNKRRSDL